MHRSITNKSKKSHDLLWSTIIELDWLKILNQDDLYAKFKQSITFPDYFWENWDAFWDIITDEDFMNNDITIYITNYENLFEDLEDKKIFSRILLDFLCIDYLDINIDIQILKTWK